MKKFAVQHELLLWCEKADPGKRSTRTFNASEGTEKYEESDRAKALGKGKGRVTDESLDRGRPPRSFLDFARENSKSKERKYGVRPHPCMKPLALCEHLVKLASNPGDVVFIPFVGSGSELLSAAKLGRVSIGAETEGEYVDLVAERFAGHGVSLCRIGPGGEHAAP